VCGNKISHFTEGFNLHSLKFAVDGSKNIKMDLQKVGCGGMDWIELAQNRDRRWPIVNAVINLWVP
jgi:hypothetical protein